MRPWQPRAGRPAGLTLVPWAARDSHALLGQIGHALVPHPPPPGAAVPFAADQVEALRRMREGLGSGRSGTPCLPILGPKGVRTECLTYVAYPFSPSPVTIALSRRAREPEPYGIRNLLWT